MTFKAYHYYTGIGHVNIFNIATILLKDRTDLL